MKIVFLGDSITEGFHELEKHQNVINLGVSGDKINNLIGRIEDVIIENPDRLIIMIGINDYLNINNYWGNPIIYNISKLYKVLIELLKLNLSKSEIICLSILPVSMNIDNKTLRKYNKDINKLNVKFNDICSNSNIQFIDISPSFMSEDQLDSTLTTDGVHLSSKGYQLYYQLIQEFLSEN